MNLYLIGFRGSGKSSVAPILAETLQWQQVDTDREIEILCGRTIAGIFKDEGEAGFRQWETTIIQAFAAENEQVISLGGGAPTIEVNREIIKQSGRAVWLTANAETLWQRISADNSSHKNRPALTSHNGGLEEVKQLVSQRADVYAECADYTIDTGNLSAEQVADRIANWWDPVDI